MVVEDAISKSIAKGNSEKTFIDKLLGREDVDAIREIISKQILTRDDVRQILYLLNSAEAKLLKYDERERYIILKFHVWIRNDVKHFDMFLEMEERYDKEGLKSLSANSIMSLREIKKIMTESIKFLIDVYLNIGRTSLSVDGFAFDNILKNRYEVGYSQIAPGATPAQGSSIANKLRGGF